LHGDLCVDERVVGQNRSVLEEKGLELASRLLPEHLPGGGEAAAFGFFGSPAAEVLGDAFSQGRRLPDVE
jgi:hypothetical protein